MVFLYIDCMRTLFDLIKDTLQEQGISQEAFAQTLGVSRQTLRGWQSSVPGPGLVRSIAEHLGVPYSQVLTAAFVSGGYLTSLTELLAGQRVQSIAYSDGPYWDRGLPEPIAVFSEKADVDRFIEASEYADPGGEYVPAELVIDGKPIPPVHTVYETVWWYRSGVRQTVFRSGELPPNLHKKEVSSVIAAEMASVPGIYELRVSSLTEASGRQAIEAARLELDAAGKLMAPEVELPPRPSSLAEMIPALSALEAARRTMDGEPESRPGDLVFSAPTDKAGPRHVTFANPWLGGVADVPPPQGLGNGTVEAWAAVNADTVRNSFPGSMSADATPAAAPVHLDRFRAMRGIPYVPFGLGRISEPPKEIPNYFAIGPLGVNTPPITPLRAEYREGPNGRPES